MAAALPKLPGKEAGTVAEPGIQSRDSDEQDLGADGMLRDLLALLQEAAPLGDRLRRAQSHIADCPPSALTQVLGPLLGAVAVEQIRDHAALSAQLQKAQFLAQHLRPAGPLQPGRLDGDARAMGQLLAGALTALAPDQRAAFFDAPAYLGANPDVAATGMDPLEHYLSSGAAEGRSPADLHRRYPESYGDQPDPATLAELLRVQRPGFVEEFPAALRDAALAGAARDGRDISVIMPSWNRRHVVAHAVSSALLQSRAPREVIVIDDGSTDGTCDHLRARFPEPLSEGRLVLIEAPHAGVAAARNTGLTAAKGQIIAYLDSDNTWEPDHLLFACAGISLGAADPETAKAPRMAYTALCRHNLRDGWSDILFQPFDRAALEAGNYIDLNSFVHDRALFDTLGGFDTGLTRFVDWDLILRYSSGEHPAAVPVITGQYFVAGKGAASITHDEPAEPNLARMRARLARDQPRDV
ncbi:glycosyltransferase family 2 protein [Puniceibacterium sp. IMCC21224]|uniref:glycosyltransferase family 2 protein n=1 Tax=Puniceibacterium sp. IMCC21224 TaxID=1618204 RepID=UPI0012E01FAA|nr:glycosyltransferase family 2 protein [Puniceibacterium sp. IMCC21224]